jgi:hypothetical protein
MSTQLQFPTPVDGTVDPVAGEAAKQVGMAEADGATQPSWRDACDAAIAVMAARGEPFQAADLIAEQLVDEPADHHQWGPRFLAAARDGLIVSVGAGPSRRVTVHRSLCRTWVGRRP